MTETDSAMWLIWFVGVYGGWCWRGWWQRRNVAPAALPANNITEAICRQMLRVEDGHRFAGDDVEVINRQAYCANGRRFTVSVQREVAP